MSVQPARIWEKWLLGAILLLALLARLYRLDALNLWFDEGFSVGWAEKSYHEILRLTFTEEPNPPIYLFFLKAWISAFGDSEFSLRLPSALFGTASVAMLASIGARFLSFRIGLLAALAAATVPMQLEFSQEARSYTLLCLLSLITVRHMPYGMVWPERSSRAKYVLAAIAVLYTHAYGVFLLIAQNLFVLLSAARAPRRAFLREWLTLQAIIGLVAAPWYLAFLFQSEAYHIHFVWIESSPPSSISSLLERYLGSSPVPGLAVVAALAAAALAVAVGTRGWSGLRRASADALVSLPGFLLLWMIVTFALPVLIAHVWHPFFVPRYGLAASMGAFLLLLACFKPLVARSDAFFAVLVLVLAAKSGYTANRPDAEYTKDRWTEPLRYIAESEGGRGPAPVVISPAYYRGTLAEYYVRRLGLEDRFELRFSDSAEEVVQLVRDRGHAWVLDVRPSSSTPSLDRWSRPEVAHDGKPRKFGQLWLARFVPSSPLRATASARDSAE